MVPVPSRLSIVRCTLIALLLSCLLPMVAVGQSTGFIVSEVQGAIGDVRLSYVFLQSSQPVQGWTIGVCHDQSSASLIGIGDGAALAVANGGFGPDFVSTTFAADGWIGSVIVDLLSVSALPPAIGLTEIHHAAYQVTATGAAGVCFCDTLGSPPVSQVVLVGGIPTTPTVLCAPPVGANVPFRRGDANGDGTVGIGDVVRILGFLFSQGAYPDCSDAADVNDDGAINVGDTVHLLTYLFQFGSPPLPAPGSSNCSTDPQLDLLPECQYTSC